MSETSISIPKLKIIGVAALLLALSGCAGEFEKVIVDFDDDSGNAVEFDTTKAAKSAFAARILFRDDVFSSNVVPGEQDCGGDARVYSNPYPFDEDGNLVSSYDSSQKTHFPQPFPQSSETSVISTTKPDFLKNVSVDLSDMNVDEESNPSFFNCSFQNSAGAPIPSACARFDSTARAFEERRVTHPTSGTDPYLYIEYSSSALSGGYPVKRYGGIDGTRFYTLLDYECIDAGPITIPDADTNKLYAGGVDIDIDRAKLGTNENVLLNLSYIPLGEDNFTPTVDKNNADYGDAVGTKFYSNQVAYFRIVLMAVGNPTLSLIQGITQPRYLSLGYLTRPKIVETFAVLSEPDGYLKEQQFVIPLSMDSQMDRIRIERISGSGILVGASIYRMGPK